MLGAVFFVTVIAVLTGHYLLVERPRRATGVSTPFPRPLPIRELIDRQPSGVFLQPTFTWAHVRADGDVELGVHPLLASLAADRPTVELTTGSDRVEKGDRLMSLRIDGHALAIRSPFAGRVLSSVTPGDAMADWDAARGQYRDWVCLMRPDSLDAEVSDWFVGREAIDWTQTQYSRIRDYLLSRSMPAGEVALADGGELPVGALGQLSDEHLTEFETLFLTG